MTKKDVAEIKRRFKKEECTFTKMCGCYVNGQKNIVLHFNETFLNLAEEEFHKYLEIAKKVASGTIGNNLLELSFLSEEQTAGGKQPFLLGLRDSKLKNEELLLRFYELIIEQYEYTGNFLILIYHDAYDVITKTNDNEKLDESEEVYEYLLCAVCPVELSKAGLGYREKENRIGSRIRDWVVTPPEIGFIFPAFSERSSDIHSVTYYTKNPKAPHPEFMESVLGCSPKRTVMEEKNTFQTILKQAFEEEKEKAEELILEIQENLNEIVEEHQNIYQKEPILLTSNTIQSVMSDSGITEEVAAKIQELCIEEFGDTPPEAKNLIDTKALAANAQKKKEQTLQQEVHLLKQQLEQIEETPTLQTSAEQSETFVKENSAEIYDVILKVNPEKISQIKSQILDGKKCIIIPLEEHEQANINGIETDI